MISAGSLLKKTLGTGPAAPAGGGMAFFTSAQFGWSGILDRSAGNIVVTLQGPSSEAAVSHDFPFRRKYFEPGLSKNRSQFVLTTNSRLVFSIGARTSSPSTRIKMEFAS